MKSFSKKRALSPSLFFLAVGALIHCGGNDGPQTSFSSQGDAAVMSGIVGTWVGTSSSGATFTMSLCENTGDTTSTASCATLHTVHGGGRGKTETVSEPEGCGGCDYDDSAYVVGLISGDDLESRAISGQFELTGGDTHGLAMPYRIDMSGPDTALNGSMDAPGTITLASPNFGGVPNVKLDAGDPSSNSNDASESDADASEPDASPLDSGTDDASTENANGVDAGDQNEIVFHRVGDVTCPLP